VGCWSGEVAPGWRFGWEALLNSFHYYWTPLEYSFSKRKKKGLGLRCSLAPFFSETSAHSAAADLFTQGVEFRGVDKACHYSIAILRGGSNAWRLERIKMPGALVMGSDEHADDMF
jgi:hypothetical protein